MTKIHLQDILCGTVDNDTLPNKKENLLKLLIADRYSLPIEAVCLEMLDFFKIVSAGAKKYSMNGWLEENGKGISHKHNHNSMFHHLADSYTQIGNDSESGEHPLLHLQCRSGMAYTRIVRGIEHDDD